MRARRTSSYGKNPLTLKIFSPLSYGAVCASVGPVSFLNRWSICEKKKKTENAEAEFTFFVCAQEVREMVAPVLKSFQAQVSRMSLLLLFFFVGCISQIHMKHLQIQQNQT